MNKFLDKLLRFFRMRPITRHLPREFHHLLDIGSGPRPWFLNLDPARYHGLSITALDKRAWPLPARAGLNVIQFELDDRLPFETEAFDLITMFATLEHLANPEAIIREVHRALVPGGTLLLTTPSRLSKPLLEFLAFRLHLIDEEEIADHKRYFTKRDLQALLIQNGFPESRTQYFELGFNLFAKGIKEMKK